MNQLIHLAEFQEVLDHYQVSPAAKQVLAKAKLALCVSPSSVGRNTIIRELLKTGDYRYIVSQTTRQPRVNDGVLEQNGREYWFISEEKMLADLKGGKLIEAAIIHNQQVSGMSISEIEKAKADNKIAITDLEVMGVENVIQAKSDTFALFVLPPNFDEWQRRMHSRGQMNEDEKRRRLESAVKELKMALSTDYYKFVINDTVENAVLQIQNIVKNSHTILQPEAIDLTKQLIDQTQRLLNNS
jgi:guanylate kinase